MKLNNGMLVVVGLIACRGAAALTISGVSPTSYRTASLVAGASYYVSGGGTTTDFSPALTDATLLRTNPSDAANPAFSLQFTIDERAEVYVCYDGRGPVPAWLSSWALTGLTVEVSDATQYSVYTRSLAAGTIILGANSAPAMYFVADSADFGDCANGPNLAPGC